jgi:plasmid stability protein
VRITADEHAVLRVLAAERAQTISDAVRTVLTSAVREEKSRRAA